MIQSAGIVHRGPPRVYQKRCGRYYVERTWRSINWHCHNLVGSFTIHIGTIYWSSRRKRKRISSCVIWISIILSGTCWGEDFWKTDILGSLALTWMSRISQCWYWIQRGPDEIGWKDVSHSVLLDMPLCKRREITRKEKFKLRVAKPKLLRSKPLKSA